MVCDGVMVCVMLWDIVCDFVCYIVCDGVAEKLKRCSSAWLCVMLWVAHHNGCSA